MLFPNIVDMKNLLRIEELLQFLAVLFYLSEKDVAWWVYLCLILAPDLSMIGYLINEKIGAWLYNLGHHKGVAVLVIMVGWVAIEPWIVLTGMVLFGHSSMDRIFGYGLKYEKGFKFTHLGEIGKAS